MLLLACGNTYEEQKRLSRAERARLYRADSLAFKVAVLPTLDCLPFYVAKERMMYDTTRLDLRLRRYTAQMDCDTALSGGSVEMAASDLVRLAFLQKRKVQAQAWTSTGAYWQLIANRKARLRKSAQFGDKMVAMTRYSATDYLTDKFLEGAKTTADVFRVQVNDVNVRLDMLLNNAMDAMWLTEPQATVAREAGNNVVADSRKMNANLGIFAIRSDRTADSHRKMQMAELRKAYNRACDSINAFGIGRYGDVISKYYRGRPLKTAALPKMNFKHVAEPTDADSRAAAIFINGK